MNFVVSRKTWCRGRSLSKLLQEIGDRCCLGFVGEQCGIDDKFLRNQCYPSDVDRSLGVKWPQWMLQKFDTAMTLACKRCAIINDDRDLTDEEREKELQKIFEANGDSISFVD